MTEWIPLVAVIVTFVVSLGGFFAWINNYVDKRHDEHTQKVSDVTDGLAQRINHHHDEFGRVHARIQDNENRIRQTRDELHERYVQHSHIDKLREENRQVSTIIFERLETMSQALNQLVGLVKGRFEGNGQ